MVPLTVGSVDTAAPSQLPLTTCAWLRRFAALELSPALLEKLLFDLDQCKYITMKTIFALALAFAVTGCSSLVSYIPSFWDDNQSARIIDVRLRAELIDCAQPQLPQVRALAQDLRWFELYSQSKGLRQTDVIKLIQPMQETVRDWEQRTARQEGSKFYCETKRKIIIEQSLRASQAILGRF